MLSVLQSKELVIRREMSPHTVWKIYPLQSVFHGRGRYQHREKLAFVILCACCGICGAYKEASSAVGGGTTSDTVLGGPRLKEHEFGKVIERVKVLFSTSLEHCVIPGAMQTLTLTHICYG